MTAGMQDHFFDSGGVLLHAASIGEGSLLVFCHGFPGLWFGWHHQYVFNQALLQFLLH